VTSRAEAIAGAIVAALTVPAMAAVPAARVFRDLDGAMQAAHLPAVAVELGDEDAPITGAPHGVADRVVTVTVSVIAEAVSGGSPYTDADAALVEAHGRVVADRELGGLAFDLVEGRTARDRDAGERHLGAIRKEYRVHYRTTEDSIE